MDTDCIIVLQRLLEKDLVNRLLIRQVNIQTTFSPHVIPAKAGIQEIQCVMDSGSPPGSSPGCGRNDGFFNCRVNNWLTGRFGFILAVDVFTTFPKTEKG